MDRADRYRALKAEVVRARTMHGLSHRQLAARANVDDATLDRILDGTARDTLDALAAVERVLGFPAGYLVTVLGYVEVADDLRGLIDRDPRLRSAGKEAILVLVDHFLDEDMAGLLEAAASGEIPINDEDSDVVFEQGEELLPPDGT